MPRHTRIKAFTLIELLVTVAITAVIAAAATGLLRLALNALQDLSHDGSTPRLQRERWRLSLAKEVYDARGIGYASGFPSTANELPGNGTLLLWRDDDVIADGRAQISEVTLIRLNAATGQIEYLTREDPTSWTSAEMMAYIEDVHDRLNDVELTEEILASNRFAATPVLGSSTHPVTGAGFAVFDPAQSDRSLVSFRLLHGTGDTATLFRGTISRDQDAN